MIRIIKTLAILLSIVIIGLTTVKAVTYKLDNLRSAQVEASQVTAKMRQTQLDCLARNISLHFNANDN